MSFEINYSFLDRTTHKLAFGLPYIQMIAADLEQSMYASNFGHIAVDKPVFVTSLPRAGTTLLLEVLNTFAVTATHTYRDMPFIMAPLIFSKAGKNFQKEATLKERFHADGIKIGYDSAEAFEEVIWKQFWRKKYKGKTIPLWSDADEDEEALEFILEHMQKIISLRTPPKIDAPRYVSKNNANIARVDFINTYIPEAKIVVPVRDPLAHAYSMLNQHKKFFDTHKKEKFALRYMRDIGHFEFGKLHKPIDFNVDIDLPEIDDDLSIAYWLTYVTKSFAYIADKKNKVIPFDYEDACRNPQTQLQHLLDSIELKYTEEEFSNAASMFHESKVYQHNKEEIPQELLTRAYALYHEILGTTPQETTPAD